MTKPTLTIDLNVITRNTRAIVDVCNQSGIEIFGVTKGTCGMPEVAAAMLDGGVKGIGESRLENVHHLRRAGITCPVMLLRMPALSQAAEVVRNVDISLNSELSVIAALSQAAIKQKVRHKVVLMVDLGDLREGVWPDALMNTVEAIVDLPGVELVGLGTNLNCLGGVLPSVANMQQLLGYADAIRERFGLPLPCITAGNSGALPLLLRGDMPKGITHLRIGEAILQGGRDTFFDTPWDMLDRNAFTLSVELLEVQAKPTVPIGQRGVNAFGNMPDFPNLGTRLRGICNIGLQDVDFGHLLPLDAKARVVGGSSDHLVMDIDDVLPVPKVGDRMNFRMTYGSLLRSMTSKYVTKIFA